MSPSGAPGVKISATPISFNFAISASGMIPPAKARTSPAPRAASSSRIFGNSVMWAPDRMDRPTASASSWITVSAICSGVWCRPV